jgi:hypothetical protein
MINEASKGGADVINMLQDVFERVVDANVPDLHEVSKKSCAKIDRGIFVEATVGAWCWYVRVWSTLVRCVNGGGAVYDQTTLAFS